MARVDGIERLQDDSASIVPEPATDVTEQSEENAAQTLAVVSLSEVLSGVADGIEGDELPVDIAQTEAVPPSVTWEQVRVELQSLRDDARAIGNLPTTAPEQRTILLRFAEEAENLNQEINNIIYEWNTEPTDSLRRRFNEADAAISSLTAPDTLASVFLPALETYGAGARQRVPPLSAIADDARSLAELPVTETSDPQLMRIVQSAEALTAQLDAGLNALDETLTRGDAFAAIDDAAYLYARLLEAERLGQDYTAQVGTIASELEGAVGQSRTLRNRDALLAAREELNDADFIRFVSNSGYPIDQQPPETVSRIETGDSVTPIESFVANIDGELSLSVPMFTFERADAGRWQNAYAMPLTEARHNLANVNAADPEVVRAYRDELEQAVNVYSRMVDEIEVVLQDGARDVGALSAPVADARRHVANLERMLAFVDSNGLDALAPEQRASFVVDVTRTGDAIREYVREFDTANNIITGIRTDNVVQFWQTGIVIGQVADGLGRGAAATLGFSLAGPQGSAYAVAAYETAAYGLPYVMRSVNEDDAAIAALVDVSGSPTERFLGASLETLMPGFDVSNPFAGAALDAASEGVYDAAVQYFETGEVYPGQVASSMLWGGAFSLPVDVGGEVVLRSVLGPDNLSSSADDLGFLRRLFGTDRQGLGPEPQDPTGLPSEPNPGTGEVEEPTRRGELQPGHDGDGGQIPPGGGNGGRGRGTPTGDDGNGPPNNGEGADGDATPGDGSVEPWTGFGAIGVEPAGPAGDRGDAWRAVLDGEPQKGGAFSNWFDLRIGVGADVGYNLGNGQMFVGLSTLDSLRTFQDRYPDVVRGWLDAMRAGDQDATARALRELAEAAGTDVGLSGEAMQLLTDTTIQRFLGIGSTEYLQISLPGGHLPVGADQAFLAVDARGNVVDARTLVANGDGTHSTKMGERVRYQMNATPAELPPGTSDFFGSTSSEHVRLNEPLRITKVVLEEYTNLPIGHESQREWRQRDGYEAELTIPAGAYLPVEFVRELERRASLIDANRRLWAPPGVAVEDGWKLEIRFHRLDNTVLGSMPLASRYPPGVTSFVEALTAPEDRSGASVRRIQTFEPPSGFGSAAMRAWFDTVVPGSGQLLELLSAVGANLQMVTYSDGPVRHRTDGAMMPVTRRRHIWDALSDELASVVPPSQVGRMFFAVDPETGRPLVNFEVADLPPRKFARGPDVTLLEVISAPPVTGPALGNSNDAPGLGPRLDEVTTGQIAVPTDLVRSLQHATGGGWPPLPRGSLDAIDTFLSSFTFPTGSLESALHSRLLGEFGTLREGVPLNDQQAELFMQFFQVLSRHDDPLRFWINVPSSGLDAGVGVSNVPNKGEMAPASTTTSKIGASPTSKFGPEPAPHGLAGAFAAVAADLGPDAEVGEPPSRADAHEARVRAILAGQGDPVTGEGGLAIGLDAPPVEIPAPDVEPLVPSMGQIDGLMGRSYSGALGSFAQLAGDPDEQAGLAQLTSAVGLGDAVVRLIDPASQSGSADGAVGAGLDLLGHLLDDEGRAAVEGLQAAETGLRLVQNPTAGNMFNLAGSVGDLIGNETVRDVGAVGGATYRFVDTMNHIDGLQTAASASGTTLANAGGLQGAAIANLAGTLAGTVIDGETGQTISNAAAVASFAMAPTPLGFFPAAMGAISLMRSAFGMDEPSSVALGRVDARGDGSADDRAVFYTESMDFGYRVDSDRAGLDIDGVRYELIAQPVHIRRDDEGNVLGYARVSGGAARRADEDGREIETRYFLNAAYDLAPINENVEAARVRLEPFRIGDNGRDGDAHVVRGHEISEADYLRLRAALGGRSGSLGGDDARVDLFRPHLDRVPVEFRQRENDLGLGFFADINADGHADFVRQDIEIEEFRGGDDSVEVSLRSRTGRELARFEAASLTPEDVSEGYATVDALVRTGPASTFGPQGPAGPMAVFGPSEPLGTLEQAGVGDLAAWSRHGGDAHAASSGWQAQGFVTEGGLTPPPIGTLDNDFLAFDAPGVFAGGAGEDRLLGSGGADRLRGDAGGDLIVGGDGADHLAGGADADLVLGDAGDDTVAGGSGNDTLLGGDGRDRIIGGAGHDLLDAGAGGGTMHGGRGDDRFIPGIGDDRIVGGRGWDSVDYAGTRQGVDVDLRTGTGARGAEGDTFKGVDEVRGATGHDRIRGADRANSLAGGDGRDRLIGRGGGDVLDGGAGDDRVRGGSGDDLLVGGAGADRLDGGSGRDLASYGGSETGVDVDLARGVARGGDAEGDRLQRIEAVAGSAAADRLTGDGHDNHLDGAGGNDRLDGAGGNDLLTGADGVDRLFGGRGDDLLDGGGGTDALRGQHGDDVLAAGAGDDRLRGGRGDDLLIGGAGADDLDGGAGNDVASYAGSPVAVAVNLRTGTTAGGDAEGDTLRRVAAVSGSDRADRLTGDGRENLLEGGEGDDRLRGLAGNDRLEGGSGRDRAQGGAGNDLVSGGAGRDRLDGDAGRDALSGGAGADLVRGGGGDDVIKGGGGRDRLLGGGHDDILDGGSGTDRARGGTGHDLVHGGAGADRLAGDAGDDELVGGAGRDRLVGGIGDDVLQGGAGADRLIAGRGDDRLDGGGGRDTAVFEGGRNRYDISRAASGDIVVVDRQTGERNVLSAIERVRFDNGSFRTDRLV